MSGDKVVPQDQSTRLPKAKLYLLFFGLQIALFISFIDSTSVSTILPTIADELNASSSITWAGTAFLVANTSFQIVTARLSDVFGRKIVLLASLGVFGFGDLLAGFAKNKIWLYCARGIAGIGGGGINSLSMIIVSDVVTVRERGKYLTLLSIGIASGAATGPFLGAVLAEKATWRWTFWIIPPLAAITMVLVVLLVPQKKLDGGIGEKVAKMDWIGSFLSALFSVAILVPLSGGGSTFEWNSPVVIALLIVGGLALGAFILVEAKFAVLPLFPGRLLRNRNICLLIIQTWLVGAVYYGGIYFTPLYLQEVKGNSRILSAALLLPLVVSQVFTASISGWVIKFTSRAWSSFTLGFLIWFAGQAGQIAFNETTTQGVIIGCLLLQGLGVGLTLQSTLVLAQASGASADRAAVTGVRNFARTGGGAIGLAIGNSVLQNVFLQNLPEDLPENIRQALKTNLEVSKTLSPEMQAAVKSAYMAGLKDVFIYFVPVIGLCLLSCAFIKDINLDPPQPKPISPTSSTEEVKEDDEVVTGDIIPVSDEEKDITYKEPETSRV